MVKSGCAVVKKLSKLLKPIDILAPTPETRRSHRSGAPVCASDRTNRRGRVGGGGGGAPRPSSKPRRKAWVRAAVWAAGDEACQAAAAGASPGGLLCALPRPEAAVGSGHVGRAPLSPATVTTLDWRLARRSIRHPTYGHSRLTPHSGKGNARMHFPVFDQVASSSWTLPIDPMVGFGDLPRSTQPRRRAPRAGARPAEGLLEGRPGSSRKRARDARLSTPPAWAGRRGRGRPGS